MLCRDPQSSTDKVIGSLGKYIYTHDIYIYVYLFLYIHTQIYSLEVEQLAPEELLFEVVLSFGKGNCSGVIC